MDINMINKNLFVDETSDNQMDNSGDMRIKEIKEEFCEDPHNNDFEDKTENYGHILMKEEIKEEDLEDLIPFPGESEERLVFQEEISGNSTTTAKVVQNCLQDQDNSGEMRIKEIKEEFCEEPHNIDFEDKMVNSKESPAKKIEEEFFDSCDGTDHRLSCQEPEVVGCGEIIPKVRSLKEENFGHILMKEEVKEEDLEDTSPVLGEIEEKLESQEEISGNSTTTAKAVQNCLHDKNKEPLTDMEWDSSQEKSNLVEHTSVSHFTPMPTESENLMGFNHPAKRKCCNPNIPNSFSNPSLKEHFSEVSHTIHSASITRMDKVDKKDTHRQRIPDALNINYDIITMSSSHGSVQYIIGGERSNIQVSLCNNTIPLSYKEVTEPDIASDTHSQEHPLHQREKYDHVEIIPLRENRHGNLLVNVYHVIVEKPEESGLGGVVRELSRFISNLRWIQEGDYHVNISFEILEATGDTIHLHIPFVQLQESKLFDYIMGQFETAIKATETIEFGTFILIIRIYRIPAGHAIIPTNVRFDRPKIYKTHIKFKGCAFVSSVLAKKMKENVPSKNFWLPSVMQEAQELARKCNLWFEDTITVDRFSLIEREQKCRILVFTAKGEECQFQLLHRPTYPKKSAPLLFIGLEGETYYPIRNIMDTYRKSKVLPVDHGMCFSCYTFHDNLTSHLKDCEGVCSQCLGQCDGKRNWPILCNKCNRSFYNQSCFNTHKELHTCYKIWMCPKCSRIISQGVSKVRRHECMRFCSLYDKADGTKHTRWMTRSRKSMVKKWNAVYYGIETYKKVGASILVPYILVMQIICELCFNKDEETYDKCKNCGARTKIFEENCEGSPFKPFIKELIRIRGLRDNVKTYVMAHNEKFSVQFIYDELLHYFNPSLFISNPIKRGRKQSQIELIQDVIFKDTFLFIPSSLKKLPQTTGIPEMGKSYFPYDFLSEETLNYVGAIPEKRYFNYEKMTNEEKVFFDSNFFAKFQEEDYDIRSECIKYCIQNISNLRLCFEKFRHSFIDRFNIDPMQSSTTIASLCHKVFKDVFLKEKSIPIIDRKMPKIFSYKALRWIMFEEHVRGIPISHARNGGERSLTVNESVFFHDGFSPLGGGTVFLFHGCYWHGCQKHDCSFKQDVSIDGRGSLDRYCQTMESERILGTKYKVISIWECQFETMMKTIPGRRELINRICADVVKGVLDVDSAPFCGRCNPFILYYPPKEGVKIHYVKFRCLYPYCMKSNHYPVGLPRRRVCEGEIPSIQEFTHGINKEYFGIVKVDVLPPTDLYIPVLPQSIGGKYTFTLCATCTQQNSRECDHSEKQRMLCGVYTTPELKLALEKMYKIKKIYEFWEFEKRTVLFAEYIKTFLKEQIEASGFPRGVDEEKEKIAYVKRVNEAEGINIQMDNIKNNLGKRFRAQLCLNGLWGKFAQRIRGSNTVICGSDHNVIELLKNDDYITNSLDAAGKAYIAKVENAEHVEVDSHLTNLLIAAFTTAYARIKLYGLLDWLGERLLYCDTDSAIFISREADPQPPFGEFLGDLTDEIKDVYGADAYGDSFCSTGPKSYSVRIQTSGGVKYILRAKGLTINPQTEDIITYDAMKRLVGAEESEEEADNGVKEVTGERVLRKTFRKRVKIPRSYRTRPFGFQGLLLDI